MCKILHDNYENQITDEKKKTVLLFLNLFLFTLNHIFTGRNTLANSIDRIFVNDNSSIFIAHFKFFGY